MASQFYPKYLEYIQGLGCGSGSVRTGTLKAALLNTDVVAYNAAHDFYNDISAGVVGTPVEITSPTFASGVLDGANVTWSSVPGTTTLEAVVVYLDTGNVATSHLICFIDSGTGLPITSDGNNIACTFSGSGICAL
jgi:hypothetical protein